MTPRGLVTLPLAASLLIVATPAQTPSWVGVPSALSSSTSVAHAVHSSLVANEGQWSSDIAFAGSLAGVALRVEQDGVVLVAHDRMQGRGAVVRLGLETDPGCAGPVGFDPVPGSNSYFLGKDPSRWRSGLQGYSKVRYASVWDGVDLVVGEEQGQPALSLEVAAGVDPEVIALRVEAGSELRLEGPADAVSETVLGDINLRLTVEQPLPDGSKRPLTSAYALTADGRLSIRASGRDEALPLEINLGLEWATFLGGSGTDYVRKIAVAPSGDVIVAGETSSSDFPVTPGALDTVYSFGTDTFVSRLDPSGSQLLMSTYIGGGGKDYPSGVGVAQDGSVVVAGYTKSSDFPTTPGAFDEVLGGFEDFFVARLTEDGQALAWSTLIGGDSGFIGEVGDSYDMVLAPDDSVYIVGVTRDGTYPVTPGAYDTTPDDPVQGPGDVVISHISSDGSALLHSTFFGGSQDDRNESICSMLDGVVVAGVAGSTNFPVTPGAYDVSPPGQFVSKLDLTLSNLVFSTVLNATDTLGSSLRDVAADPSGNVTVVGWTYSPTWPTTPGAFDTTHGGVEDVFVTKLNPTGSALIYSTYLGGGGRDGAWALDVDSAGVATVGGFTTAFSSASFPVTPGAWDVTGNGDFDAFVARLSPDGSQVWYGTFLGGTKADCDNSLGGRLDVLEVTDGSALVGGGTPSTDFPVTAGAYDNSFSGGSRDGYLAKLTMLPQGVSRYGSSTEGCAGYLAMGVTAMPQVGKAFTLTCRNAPASSLGLLALGLSDLAQPLIAKGAALWVDPNPLFLLLSLGSNAVGFASIGGVLPNDPGLAGASFTVQCFWPDECAASGPFSASNALAITIQP